jgi:zinc protease
VIERTSWLGHANLFHGDPDRLTTELERLRAVTPDDVLRVARAYLLGRPRVVLVGRSDRTARARRRRAAARERTVRRRRAARGSAPLRPLLGRSTPPGLEVAPRERRARARHALRERAPRAPLAGRARRAFARGARAARARVARGRDAEGGHALARSRRLTERVDSLGAEFQAFADDDEIALRMTVLAEHLAEAAALVSELVLEPRFARADFERLQRQRLLRIDTRGDRIRTLADDAFARLLWSSTGSVRAEPDAGTRATIERVDRRGRAGLLEHAGARSAPRGSPSSAPPARTSSCGASGRWRSAGRRRTPSIRCASPRARPSPASTSSTSPGRRSPSCASVTRASPRSIPTSTRFKR